MPFVRDDVPEGERSGKATGLGAARARPACGLASAERYVRPPMAADFATDGHARPSVATICRIEASVARLIEIFSRFAKARAPRDRLRTAGNERAVR
jgi:hypothetical protein